MERGSSTLDDHREACIGVQGGCRGVAIGDIVEESTGAKVLGANNDTFYARKGIGVTGASNLKAAVGNKGRDDG
eukprot:9820373-Prorocentrum_lima.AAC.1